MPNPTMRAFPTPKSRGDGLKKGINKLCQLRSLEKDESLHLKWAAPAYIIPKKDGSV